MKPSARDEESPIASASRLNDDLLQTPPATVRSGAASIPVAEDLSGSSAAQESKTNDLNGALHGSASTAQALQLTPSSVPRSSARPSMSSASSSAAIASPLPQPPVMYDFEISLTPPLQQQPPAGNLPSPAIGQSGSAAVAATTVVPPSSDILSVLKNCNNKRKNEQISSPSATAPKMTNSKNGKRITRAFIYMFYNTNPDSSKSYVGLFIGNVFDLFNWVKGEVPLQGELLANKQMHFLYPNKRTALLAAAGLTPPGFDILANNRPIWCFISNIADNGAVAPSDSAAIVDTVDQFRRLVPGLPDSSNNGGNAEFALEVTEVPITSTDIPVLFALRLRDNKPV